MQYSSIIDVELNLVVGKIKFVLPNFIPTTFSICNKNSKCLHFNIKVYFSNCTNTITWPSPSFLDQSRCQLTLHMKVLLLSVLEARWTKMVINLCVEFSLISMIDCSIHHCDKNTLFRRCWLHRLSFIRLCAYIVCFTIDIKCL